MFSDTPNHRAPGSGELPVEWIKNDRMQWAVRQVNQDIDSFIYNYGEIQGYLPLREQLVQYLDLLGIHTSADNIVTTTGVSQAILTVIQLLLNVGDTVVVDSPGWYWTSSTLQQQGYQVISVERDYQGPNFEQMRQLLEEHRPKLYITNSVLHNPTSYNLHPARAHQVLNLMHEYDTYIFEDDLYAVFLANDKPLRYANIDQFERVFYATGFSKSMASGWRVGMLVSPDKFINQIIKLKTLSNMTSPEFGERVVHKLWTQGEYRRQLKKVQRKLYLAHQYMRKALSVVGLSYPEHTNSGIFVWVDTGVDSGQLALDAYKNGWLVAPGQLFNPKAQASTYLRLNVATTSDEFLEWLNIYLNKVNGCF
ncbi:PLP-dependent aminotransferase family protein [Psychrobacter sp. DM4]|uniref:aminotransferase-like domain-containing protein n=1 Tax=Psychrobacter sp. DM4 TaxID=3440637 RepID=UPI003F506259